MRNSLTLQALSERILLNFLLRNIYHQITNDDQLIIKLQCPKIILLKKVVCSSKFIINHQLIIKIIISGKEE